MYYLSVISTNLPTDLVSLLLTTNAGLDCIQIPLKILFFVGPHGYFEIWVDEWEVPHSVPGSSPFISFHDFVWGDSGDPCAVLSSASLRMGTLPIDKGKN